MAAASRTDPYLGYRFLVEIEGLVVGGFSEVSGLSVEMTPEEYAEGGLNAFTHKLPTRFSHPNLVLSRGLTDSSDLWTWCQESAGWFVPTIRRRNVRIVLLDAAGAESWGWEVAKAYPVQWSGPELRADRAAVAIERLELAHRGVSAVEGLPP